jgi:hypothetical protein
MIELAMHPETPAVMWDQFLKDSPPFSIAIDGYVGDAPKFDPSGPRANMNHHEACDRLATRSTCAQMLMVIRQGLFRRFRNKNGPKAILWANDCDEDVCTTVFLARNHWLAEGTMNPVLNRLVAMEDCLDCTAGAYPFPADLPALQELAWVFAPYRQFRASGGLERRHGEAFTCVVEDVCDRIGRHVTGRGDRLPLDVRYDRIGGGPGYVVVKEIGAHARTGMFSDGIQAYVSVRERAVGRWQYVIGRLSPFVFVDTSMLAAFLNDREGIDPLAPNAPDRWGGGNSIIGSPRVGGSRLNPEELVKVINEFLKDFGPRSV